MDKRYLEPEMEVVNFEETDVILASEPLLPDSGSTFETNPKPFGQG